MNISEKNHSYVYTPLSDKNIRFKFNNKFYFHIFLSLPLVPVHTVEIQWNHNKVENGTE